MGLKEKNQNFSSPFIVNGASPGELGEESWKNRLKRLEKRRGERREKNQ